MAHDFLQTQEEIYKQLRDSLTGKITQLTNFTDRSFNYVWTQAFSEELREVQELTLVAELAGFIDYSGGPVTEDDLESLGLEDQISAERVNELMLDEYLDEYVKIVGVTRDDGSKATGEVTFQTQSQATSIPEGTRVTTPPDSSGETKDYLTTDNASTSSGEQVVSGVPIEAISEGEEFNVPAGEIIRVSNPPIGVTGVSNTSSTTGGENVETNDELRERAKSAVGGASEGGTVEGIKAYLRNNVDAIQQGDVIIDEFTSRQPPFVDVIVDGGVDSVVSDAIEFSRPAGIEHNLVRPEIIQISSDIDLRGSDIDTTSVTNTIEEFLLESGIGENFYLDQYIREIMQSDDDIINIDDIDGNIEKVTNETFTYTTEISSALAYDDSETNPLTEETIAANNDDPDDVTLLPASPEVGDAYYFGSDNLFSEIEIDISTTESASANDWNIVWEYYDGSTWAGLNNVTDGTSDFRSAGIGTVEWDVPTDWTPRVVDEDGYYYVRARLDSFTSISTQPLGRGVDITGRGYDLEFTFEDLNGSIEVVDKDEDSYVNNTDFIVVDKSGDGWKETLIWGGGLTPDENENFFVDYDVTVIGQTKNGNKHGFDEVRDEAFTFNIGQEDSFDYNNTDPTYPLNFIPFDSTITVVDENATTFTQGTDYQLAPLQDFASEDVIEFVSGTNEYALSEDYDFADNAVIDADGIIYEEGVDYQFLDTDGDGFDDTIDWSLAGATPADQTNFTVNYNAYNNEIRWDQNQTTPPQDDQFTATYDQVLYETELEIVETPGGIIRDSDGTVYNQDTEYITVDASRDNENDAIFWEQNPSTLDDDEEFYFTYLTEGDLLIADRQKVDPGTIATSVN